MKTIAIDTNILLDFFLERENYSQAKKLIEQSVINEFNIYIPIPVLLEFAWTLKSYYKIEKTIIVDRLTAVLRLQNCKIPDKNRVIKALLLHKNTPQVSFVDCIIVLEAIANKCTDLVTSDKKLTRLYKKIK
ncbi:MAG: hypothetical protein CEN91_122 [Candidatus Berkelbacteria bacterium Licking1014_85]|uniref:PIN domain-containing protein n=1 Tax=Candidatus Berkelbacteria bacterium Licking1014_85 TaxID=2017148 RepID=A0A554LLN5_9BACT|nr:MAG: hypothetical protein CEN91_122 [Candidatus Berkelbacteria bacterium Licking1014_85]